MTEENIQNRIAEIRKNWKQTAGDEQAVLLTKLEKTKRAWKPLTDYLDTLAEMRLDREDISFSYQFKFGKGDCGELHLEFYDNDLIDQGWKGILARTNGIYFNIPDKYAPCMDISIFHRGDLGIQKGHPLEDHLFDPAKQKDVDALKEIITEWFAQMVGTDFDPDARNPGVVEGKSFSYRKPELS